MVFFLYWMGFNMEVDILDISFIRDIWIGWYVCLFKDFKIWEVLGFGGFDVWLEEKLMMVVFGLDLVNIVFLNFMVV